MLKADPKALAALLSGFVFLIMRWRWDYIAELYHQPRKLIKFLLIWGLLGLVILRILWQVIPAYFS